MQGDPDCDEGIVGFARYPVMQGHVEGGQIVAIGTDCEIQAVVVGLQVEGSGRTVGQLLSTDQNVAQQLVAVVLAPQENADLDQLLQLRTRHLERLGRFREHYFVAIHDTP